MPLPHASCAADVPGSVCCDTFWLLGERIRTVASQALADCMVPECADRTFYAYQSEGDRTQDPLGECLIVNFIRASVRSTDRAAGGVQPIVVTRTEFRVELLENGWPILGVSDGGITPPDREMIYALAKHARAHAEKMWRALLHAAATTNQTERLYPTSTNPHVMNRGVGVGDLQPLPRPGPQIGYYMTMTVDTALT